MLLALKYERMPRTLHAETPTRRIRWEQSGPTDEECAGFFVISAREVSMADVAYTLAHCRSHFERRAVILAKDRATLLDGLAALADGWEGPTVVPAAQGEPVKGRLAFVGLDDDKAWSALNVTADLGAEGSAAAVRRLSEERVRFFVVAPGTEPLDQGGDGGLADHTLAGLVSAGCSPEWSGCRRGGGPAFSRTRSSVAATG